MTDEHLTEDESRQVHRIKRSYWTQKGIAKEYQYCAYKPEPITRLKNVVEIGFVTRNVVGSLVLDAGAGTGRFTLPLHQRGVHTIALDISVEMLGEGARRAEKMNVPFPALSGDIERLPFPDNTFDSVVSITVLRHFPEWTAILDEYVRVLRPDGRIIFDMASGDQAAYMRANGLIEEETDPYFDPVSFDKCLSMRELTRLVRERGLRVVATVPNDFFNENHLLERLLGDDLESFNDQLRDVLDKDAAIILSDMLVRRLFPALSPAVSSSWLMVLEKRPADTPYEPPYRTVIPPDCGTSEERAMAILRQCLRANFDTHVRECAQAWALPETQELVAFCREKLLPLFPLETLYWEDT